MKLFGFEIKRTEDENENIQTFSAPLNDDGAINISSSPLGGAHSAIFNMEGAFKTESDLVTKYRSMAIQPEIRMAVESITNEAICVDTGERVVNILLDDIDIGDKTKKRIYEEFENVLKVLNFSNTAYEIFRNWYIDGRLNFHVVIDENDLKKGIVEARYIDPRKIRFIREIDEKPDREIGSLTNKKIKNEYYLYSDIGFGDVGQTGNVGGFYTTPYNNNAGSYNDNVRIAKDSIVRVTSGLVAEDNSLVLSYLHSSIKPLNLLRSLEDANVIYTLTRAPERRAFYIDVGNLPTHKAEQYMYDMMQRHKNKLAYDPVTGNINDQRRFLTMTEDFWFPRREGCFSLETKIPLLDGRTIELGQAIVEYKQGKQNWAYSISPEGNVVPGKITWAGVTRNNTEVMDIVLDNGETITATPDHKFILRTGEKIQAKDLVAGASLMPFNSDLRKKYNESIIKEIGEELSPVENDTSKEIWEKLKQNREVSVYEIEKDKITNETQPTKLNSYQKAVGKIVLRELMELVKNALINDPSISNKEIIKLTNEYFGTTLVNQTFKKYMNRNGYESVDHFIYRAIGEDYTCTRRLKRINDLNTINHMVVDVIFRTDRLDVGTLTIDGDHEYHDYHNFALSAGIFVMNSRSTEIDVLQGGGSLSDNEQLDYFQKNLYKSLNIPLSRLEAENMYTFGRVTEMSREEVHFNKFIRRLRARFSTLFDKLLERQLILKGVISPDEWIDIQDKIRYDFIKDNFFEELKSMEILREKVSLFESIENMIGKHFSMRWAYRNILFMSTDQMDQMREEIESERALGFYDQIYGVEQPDEELTPDEEELDLAPEEDGEDDGTIAGYEIEDDQVKSSIVGKKDKIKSRFDKPKGS